MNQITNDIQRTLGVLSENNKTGWRKLLRIVSWNGAPGKYDIRDWSPEDTRCSKSSTLTEAEARTLLTLLMAEFGGSDGK